MVSSCWHGEQSPDDLRFAQEFVEDTRDEQWLAHLPRYKTDEQENPPAPIERETNNSMFPIVAVMQRQSTHPSIATMPPSSHCLLHHSKQQMYAVLPGPRVVYECFDGATTALNQDER